ncbi:fluoride efflux transporter FluC [Microbacterium sp. P06]|uniref:fluoride efflux transporter FluC n=1 Tax=unclassified Microbacterium TaxID=2609290 RepID=UPI003744D77A
MTPLLFAAAAAAGGVGAALRYLVDMGVTRMLGARVPWGILLVNLTGAFTLGFVSAGIAGVTGVWVIGAGLLGGYTTFSSVSVGTVLLAEERRAPAAVLYAVGTFVGSILAAVAGLAVGSLVG